MLIQKNNIVLPKHPVKQKCFEKFLKAHKCVKAGQHPHEKWDCPNCFRPIIFQKGKDVKPFQIYSNLKTMGLSKQYFYDWVKANC